MAKTYTQNLRGRISACVKKVSSAASDGTSSFLTGVRSTLSAILLTSAEVSSATTSAALGTAISAAAKMSEIIVKCSQGAFLTQSDWTTIPLLTPVDITISSNLYSALNSTGSRPIKGIRYLGSLSDGSLSVYPVFAYHINWHEAPQTSDAYKNCVDLIYLFINKDISAANITSAGGVSFLKVTTATILKNLFCADEVFPGYIISGTVMVSDMTAAASTIRSLTYKVRKSSNRAQLFSPDPSKLFVLDGVFVKEETVSGPSTTPILILRGMITAVFIGDNFKLYFEESGGSNGMVDTTDISLSRFSDLFYLSAPIARSTPATTFAAIDATSAPTLNGSNNVVQGSISGTTFSISPFTITSGTASDPTPRILLAKGVYFLSTIDSSIQNSRKMAMFINNGDFPHNAIIFAREFLQTMSEQQCDPLGGSTVEIITGSGVSLSYNISSESTNIDITTELSNIATTDTTSNNSITIYW